jgi:chromosome segregation ATPase
VGETDRDAPRAPSRFADLKNKIQQATQLIGELRETNYSLSGEVAALKRELESRPERDVDAEAGSAELASKVEADADVSAELEALRNQRKAIRKKVEMLLERIEKLET